MLPGIIHREIDASGKSGWCRIRNAMGEYESYSFQLADDYQLIWNDAEPYQATLRYQVMRGWPRRAPEWVNVNHNYRYEGGRWQAAK